MVPGIRVIPSLRIGNAPDPVQETQERIKRTTEAITQIDERMTLLKEGEAQTQLPMSKQFGQKVFIGHGQSQLWRELKDFLEDRLQLHWEEFNRESVAGRSTKERLEEMLNNAGFAFIVMTAEDEDKGGTLHPRANVIHEAGLFQGRLGFERAIILLEESCSEFSNIHGLTQIRFPAGRISAVFEDVRRVLEREGVLANHSRNQPIGRTQVQTHAQASKVEQRPQSMGRLVFLRGITITVRFEPDGDLIEFYKADDGAHACIACFRNDPSSVHPGDEDNVRAQIRYFNKEGNEVGNGVSRAFWLRHKGDLVDFPVGESQCVILVLVSPNGELNAPGMRRVSHFNGDSVGLDGYEIDEPLGSVEVRLIGESNATLLGPLMFDFAIKDGNPSVRARQ